MLKNKNTTTNDQWANGQLLAYSGIDGQTDYNQGLTLRTICDEQGIGLEIKQPGSGIIRLSTETPITVLLTSDQADLLYDNGRIRLVMLDAWNLLIEHADEVDVSALGSVVSVESVVMSNCAGRTLISVPGKECAHALASQLDDLCRARLAWEHCVCPQDAGPTLRRAIRQMKGMTYAPEGIFTGRWSTPDRWPHRMCWLWDSAFHAIGMRHLDLPLAQEFIDAVFLMQRQDGFIPIASPPERANPPYTQPPTLALAMWCCVQQGAPVDWVKGHLQQLEDYLAWDLEHRDSGNGLPVWMIEGNVNCRSGESGLDNSPRFDAATAMEAVDFSAFLSLEYELLALLAKECGHDNLACRAIAHHERLNELINERLWDEKSRCYLDYDLEVKSLSPVRAITSLLPLICGAADDHQVAAMEALVRDPQVFGTEMPLPSIARDDARYKPDMWCGPVWINLAWLVTMGFARYGRTQLAQELSDRLCAGIEKWYTTHGSIFEFFDADGVIPPPQLNRKGKLAPEIHPYHQVIHDFGWSASLYIDFVMSERSCLPTIKWS